MRRIKIVNDTGIGKMTKITFADTGEEILGIRNIELDIPVNGIISAKLEFIIPEITIEACAKLSSKTKEGLLKLKKVLEEIEK